MLTKILNAYANHITTKKKLVELLEQLEGKTIHDNTTNQDWIVYCVLYKGRTNYIIILDRPLKSIRDIFRLPKKISLLDFLLEYKDGKYSIKS